MRTIPFVKTAALATVLVMGAIASLPAEAGPRGRVNVWFGGPLWWPGYWSYPSYPVVVQQPVIVPAETLVVQPSAPQNQLWYYCRDAQMYYPYVTSCPSAWQEVPATPAPAAPAQAPAAADVAPAPAITRTAPAPVPPARQNAN